MSVSDGIRVRRVQLRDGSDADLTALHTVEVPIEAERGSNRMPSRLESYIAFARNLPSQFNDHAWLVELSDGTPIASGYCWSNASGDPRVMECDLLVRRDCRREGIGSRLLAEICAKTAKERRTLLTWSTFDTVPAAEVFSAHLGARAARVNRTSELAIDDVDWTMIDDWARADGPRRRGYALQAIDGPFPDHLRSDAAQFHHIMQTAPREGLDVGDETRTTEDVADLDRVLVESGRIRWTLFVRDPAGTCVGGTEVTYDPWDPTVVHQQNTGIDPAHRGQGLAKWAKATMLTRIRAERPEAWTVRTDNAFSNEPMLALNNTLGFEVTTTRTEWISHVETIRETLANAALRSAASLTRPGTIRPLGEL